MRRMILTNSKPVRHEELSDLRSVPELTKKIVPITDNELTAVRISVHFRGASSSAEQAA